METGKQSDEILEFQRFGGGDLTFDRHGQIEFTFMIRHQVPVLVVGGS